MIKFWILLIIICIAGAIGGFANALITDNGFALPRTERIDNGVSILRPGYLGNVIVGAISAGISWGLYGPMANIIVLGSEAAIRKNPEELFGISLSSLVGAVLIGVGGARWLTNEVDKTLLKAAASKAAESQATSTSSKQIASASPIQALNIAKSMQAP